MKTFLLGDFAKATPSSGNKI